jgi:hypothetical protein
MSKPPKAAPKGQASKTPSPTPAPPFWPFPSGTGPIPWTAAQVRKYEREQLQQIPPAPF